MNEQTLEAGRVESTLEVADIFRSYKAEFFEKYGDSLSMAQRRVFGAIIACRTKTLGGHRQRCNQCGHERVVYNSCRDRHCPKCQAMAQAKWMEERAAELLPVPYLHVVFTLPTEIGPLALQNKQVVYGILLRASAETLKQLAADPKHLGAEIGILSILHTWGQNLMHHPHVHCVVTGGGISPDQTHWVHCKRSKRGRKVFFVPVKVLGSVFRGKFIDLLKRAFRHGQLQFFGDQRELARPEAFEHWLDRSVRQNWVVFAKRPFGSPERVLKYLARYTHRVAISNRRLIAIEDGRVHFHWKDYADGGRQKTMELEPVEFIRRFLLHVLPSGFVRIRHYGLLANRFREDKLSLCRRLLGVRPIPAAEDAKACDNDLAKLTELSNGVDHRCRCPLCGKGRMMTVQEIPPQRNDEEPAGSVPSALQTVGPP